MYKDMDSSHQERPDISKIRDSIREVTHRMDMAYGLFGSLFRSGSRQTFFADLISRYADLYAASFVNLVYYPLSYMFRAPAMLMPHESTVAHEQKSHMKPIITRQRTPSMERMYHASMMRVHSQVPSIMPSAPQYVTHGHDEDSLGKNGQSGSYVPTGPERRFSDLQRQWEQADHKITFDSPAQRPPSLISQEDHPRLSPTESLSDEYVSKDSRKPVVDEHKIWRSLSGHQVGKQNYNIDGRILVASV